MLRFEHAGEHVRAYARDRATRARTSGVRIPTSSSRCWSTTRCHEPGALLVCASPCRLRMLMRGTLSPLLLPCGRL
jgi:hypothetical protein